MASSGPQNSMVVVSTLRTQLVPGRQGGEAGWGGRVGRGGQVTRGWQHPTGRTKRLQPSAAPQASRPAALHCTHRP